MVYAKIKKKGGGVRTTKRARPAGCSGPGRANVDRCKQFSGALKRPFPSKSGQIAQAEQSVPIKRYASRFWHLGNETIYFFSLSLSLSRLFLSLPYPAFRSPSTFVFAASSCGQPQLQTRLLSPPFFAKLEELAR